MTSSLVRTALLASLVGLASPALADTAKAPTPAPSKDAVVSKDIVDTAVADGRFKTLVAAVKEAGLVDTLKSAGPFTVFAPTDDAFAKIPADTLKAVMADKAKLTSILTYHVVSGTKLAADVVKAKTLKTVQGGAVAVKASKAGVTVGGAKVVITDIKTSNGVIHVIDTVLMPKK
jgi:uncharacterized surface protein with fasciclin (FAS1) repeats